MQPHLMALYLRNKTQLLCHSTHMIDYKILIFSALNMIRMLNIVRMHLTIALQCFNTIC